MKLKNWTVTVCHRASGNALQEEDVAIKGGSASCVTRDLAVGENFYIIMEASAARNFNIYAGIFCDGLLFDHFVIPGHETRMLSTGCEFNSTIYPYRLVDASAFRFRREGTASAKRQLQGRVRISLHKLGREHPSVESESMSTLPPKTRFSHPKQTHYIGLDVAHVPGGRRHERLTDFSCLADPFVAFTFDYSPAVLARQNDPKPFPTPSSTSNASTSQGTGNTRGKGDRKRPRSPSTSDDDDNIVLTRRPNIKSEETTGILQTAQSGASGSASTSAGSAVRSSEIINRTPGMKEEALRLKEEALALARAEIRLEAHCEEIVLQRKLRKTGGRDGASITISDSDD